MNKIDHPSPNQLETFLPESSKHYLSFQLTRIDDISDLRTLHSVRFTMGKFAQGRLRDCELRKTAVSPGSIGGQYTSPADSTLKVFSRWRQHGKELHP